MIERTFKDIDEQQIFDADKQNFLTQLGWSDGLTWEALLRSKRILLISEAGSGKTHECREQACLLAAKGEAAFFVELASLAPPICEICWVMRRRRVLIYGWPHSLR